MTYIQNVIRRSISVGCYKPHEIRATLRVAQMDVHNAMVQQCRVQMQQAWMQSVNAKPSGRDHG